MRNMSMSKMFSGVPSFLGVLLFILGRIVIHAARSNMALQDKLFVLAFMGLACLLVSAFTNSLEQEVKKF